MDIITVAFRMILCFAEGLIVIGLFATMLLLSTVSIIFLFLYVKDTILFGALVPIGKMIIRRFKKINNTHLIEIIKEKIAEKEVYLTYEVPLVSLCFSAPAILLLSSFVPSYNYIIRSFIACIFYALLYLFGMRKRCGSDYEHYERVINNNLGFLKISFSAVGFLLAVGGFLFGLVGLIMSVTEYRKQDIRSILEIDIYNVIKNITHSFYQGSLVSDGIIDFVPIISLLFVVIILFMIVFYILSLPIQGITYFLLKGQRYYHEYRKSYDVLFKCYLGIMHSLFRKIIGN